MEMDLAYCLLLRVANNQVTARRLGCSIGQVTLLGSQLTMNLFGPMFSRVLY